LDQKPTPRIANNPDSEDDFFTYESSDFSEGDDDSESDSEPVRDLKEATFSQAEVDKGGY